MVKFKEFARPSYSIYLINWLFGIGVIEFPLGNPHPVISFIYSLILVTSYCGIATIGYPYFIDAYTLYDNVVQVKILFYSKIIIIISTMSLSWYNSEGLSSCFKILAQADNFLERIGIEKNYAKIFKVQFFKIILQFFLVGSTISMTLIVVLPKDAALEEKIYVIITTGYPVVLMLITDSSFTSIVGYARFKMDKLNELLQKLKTVTFDSPQHKRILKSRDESQGSITKDFFFIIKSARQAHFKLVEGCNVAIATFGLQMLLSIGVAFAVITGEIYNAYVVLTADHIPLETVKKAIFVLGVLIYFYGQKIMFICFICSTCIESSIKTGDIINVLYDEPYMDEDSQNEIRNFNVQLIQKPLKFTAYGFIDLDYTLAITMIGSITTYLMIMIQLENPTPTDCHK